MTTPLGSKTIVEEDMGVVEDAAPAAPVCDKWLL